MKKKNEPKKNRVTWLGYRPCKTKTKREYELARDRKQKQKGWE